MRYAVLLGPLAVLLPPPLPAQVLKPFAIEVVDGATGRGVPLAELRTVSQLRYVTDSAGLIAFDEPALFGREVFFTVSAPGYEYPADGFGQRGRALKITAGGSAQLKVKRLAIAERLYRSTGEGIYADSAKLGRPLPLKEPLLNAGVAGCDSVLNAVYGGKIFWIWGDTNRINYPLGNFQSTAALSDLPNDGGLDPDRGIDFRYFEDGKGFVKGIAPMPGQGPTWIESLVVLKGEGGRERLWMSYIKADGLKAKSRGTAVFDDGKKQFVHAGPIDLKAPAFPRGHAFIHGNYVYFAHPFPLVRVPVAEAAFADATRYESYTCLKEGSTLDKPLIDRDETGTARYRWRKNAPALEPAGQAQLIKAGLLEEAEVLLPLKERDTGRPVKLHNGSTYWNPYRKTWITIANEEGGQGSYLGEVWFTESETLEGKRTKAVKIASHPKMDFYNPKQDPFFDRDGGRVIYFEGTYTNTFSGNPLTTPRYEYNQLMYRLDLGDARLAK